MSKRLAAAIPVGLQNNHINIFKLGFSQRYELTQSPGLRTQVRMATIKAANDVLSDPAKIAEHPFCYLIIKEPLSNYWLDQLMFSVISNEVITESSPDGDVQFQVNSVFSRHALAFNTQS